MIQNSLPFALSLSKGGRQDGSAHSCFDKLSTNGPGGRYRNMDVQFKAGTLTYFISIYSLLQPETSAGTSGTTSTTPPRRLALSVLFGGTSPRMSSSAMRFSSSAWMARFSGRAP